MSVLEIRALQAGYRGRAVLHDVDLDFDPGLHLLVGPNGAGKTTLFRTLAGVLTPMAGRVLIAGRDPSREPDAKSHVGVGAHRTALAPRLSVEDNLQYWARVLDIAPAMRSERVGHALSLLDLDSIAARRAGSLSRGQAQRVSLARALLGDPPVLLLDEPLSGIDPGVGVQLRGHLRDLADAGHTVIVSTHELAHASEIGDDVTVLKAGRVAGQGETSALRSELFGDRQRVRIRARGDLTAALSRLGYEGEPGSHGAVVVDVADQEAVERLVAGLVAQRVGIREVTPAENPLEDLYLGIERQAVAANGAAQRGTEALDAR